MTEPLGIIDQQRVDAAARQFQVAGKLVRAAPFGAGHIHDSYCAVFEDAGVLTRILLQRINHAVFRNPAALSENIERVTAHLALKVAGEPEKSRRVLSLVPTRDGQFLHVDEAGNFWRAFPFIERTHTYDAVSTPEQAFEAGKAFGQFQSLLVDFPPPRLHDTIPGFHNTPMRFQALEQAIEADIANRAAEARPEIEFALAHQPLASALLRANLPERVTHNDTKINNVLFDDATGQGICVIDLDTVMPGLAPYDFGDLVRTTTCRAPEDERDLSRVALEFPLFASLARGYLSSASSFLTEAEKQALVLAGKVITFEQGIRFLADHLAGDRYFKIHRENHNLDRTRAQFKLLESIEQQEEKLCSFIDSIK
jgi:Ser/Thr protein kinase RdoA (MazF antagonist)